MILKNVMESISRDSEVDSEEVVKRPCEVFHAIGGGTGGLVSLRVKGKIESLIDTHSLIAVFLVILKMTATETLEEFTTLVDEVLRTLL